MTVLKRSSWGSIGAVVDSTVSGNGIGVEILAAGRPVTLRHFSVSLYGGVHDWRILAFRGPIPNDVTSLQAYDATSGLPTSSAAEVGIDPLYEVITKANSVVAVDLPPMAGIGPQAQGGDYVSVLAIPLNPGAAGDTYVSVNAFGGPDTSASGLADSGLASIPRYLHG